MEAARCSAWLVQYSTDYVYDGHKGAPYVEDEDLKRLLKQPDLRTLLLGFCGSLTLNDHRGDTLEDVAHVLKLLGVEYEDDFQVLRAHIANLRKKIEPPRPGHGAKMLRAGSGDAQHDNGGVAALRKEGLKPTDFTIVEVGIAAMDAALRTRMRNVAWNASSASYVARSWS